MFSKKSYEIVLFTFFAVLIWISSAGYLLAHEIESAECHADPTLNRHHCHSNGQEVGIPRYERKLFGKWLDLDGDCQNTRHELLIKLSTDTVGFSENFCRTVSGRWLGPYSGDIFLESSKLDIDHLVPLKFAWEHGAYSWSKKKRIFFPMISKICWLWTNRLTAKKERMAQQTGCHQMKNIDATTCSGFSA